MHRDGLSLVATPYGSKGRTQNDGFHELGHRVIRIFHILDPLIDPWLVRKSDGAPQGVSQKFSSQLPVQVVSTLFKKVGLQAIETRERMSISESGIFFDGATGLVALTLASQRVKTLQRHANGVDALMTSGTAWVLAVCLGQGSDAHRSGIFVLW